MMRFNLLGAKVSGNVLIYQFALTVIFLMRFNLHGVKVSGNILMYQFVLIVVIWYYYSNSKHESNSALYTE